MAPWDYREPPRGGRTVRHRGGPAPARLAAPLFQGPRAGPRGLPKAAARG